MEDDLRTEDDLRVDDEPRTDDEPLTDDEPRTDHEPRMADLRVVELSTTAQLRAAADLLSRTWRTDPDQLINAGLMRALVHSGNYVAGAFRGDVLVGTAVGFLGDGYLHSHLTGVERAGQGRGVGYALKQHQRAWAVRRELAAVCWTFDPLVRRNAYFNLHKLGASATEYLPDFYGPMSDAINFGDVTDRLYVRWEVASPRALAAARGDTADVDLDALRAGGAATLVELVGEEPVIKSDRPAGADAVLLVAVPPDVESLRSREPEAAARWRYAVRDALHPALADGYRIVGISRDGHYALRKDEDAL